MYKRLIVPLDGSELAESALPEAQALARMSGSELILARVVDFTHLEHATPFALALEYAPLEGVLSEEITEATTYLDNIASELRAGGLPVSTVVMRGRVPASLEKLAEPNDLIVMTTHGRGGVARWFLGSVAEELVRHAKAPVLLVRSRVAAEPSPALVEPAIRPSTAM